MTTKSKPQKQGALARFLDGVEWLGNLLPHPVTLFALICIAVLLVSGFAGYFEWSVADPRPEGAKGRSGRWYHPRGQPDHTRRASAHQYGVGDQLHVFCAPRHSTGGLAWGRCCRADPACLVPLFGASF